MTLRKNAFEHIRAFLTIVAKNSTIKYICNKSLPLIIYLNFFYTTKVLLLYRLGVKVRNMKMVFTLVYLASGRAMKTNDENL